jgi:hypothetical protein
LCSTLALISLMALRDIERREFKARSIPALRSTDHKLRMSARMLPGYG